MTGIMGLHVRSVILERDLPTSSFVQYDLQRMNLNPAFEVK